MNLDCVQVFLIRGNPAPDSSSVYFVVSNADELFEFQTARGVEVVEAPCDQEYGFREFTVRDLDGYALNFGHRL